MTKFKVHKVFNVATLSFLLRLMGYICFFQTTGTYLFTFMHNENISV